MADQQPTNLQQRKLSLPTFNIVLACLLFAIGQTLGWFQLNSQFVWDWWKDKPLIAAVLFSVPTGICFWYGIKLCYEEWGEVDTNDDLKLYAR